jgi:hypothetical protein
LGVEEERFRDDLSAAIPAFVGIAAFAAEGKFLPISAKLSAQPRIRRSTPDIPKGILSEIPEAKFFLRVIRAAANRPVPMNDRIVPELFTRVAS